MNKYVSSYKFSEERELECWVVPNMHMHLLSSLSVPRSFEQSEL
jgi:hypothetical protein